MRPQPVLIPQRRAPKHTPSGPYANTGDGKARQALTARTIRGPLGSSSPPRVLRAACLRTICLINLCTEAAYTIRDASSSDGTRPSGVS
jgi:hypothetical protein